MCLYTQRMNVPWIVRLTVVALLVPCSDSGSTSGTKRFLDPQSWLLKWRVGKETWRGWLTEWVSSLRVASSPIGAAHVCSFSPALRLESADPSGPRRPSSAPNTVCSLLTPVASRWRAEPSADANKPSERMIPDMRVMFNGGPRNLEVGHKLFWSQLTPPHHRKHLHWRPLHRGRWLVSARTISALIGREESSSAGMSAVGRCCSDPWRKDCAKDLGNDFLSAPGDLDFCEFFKWFQETKENTSRTRSTRGTFYPQQ